MECGNCCVVRYSIGVTRNAAAHMIWVFILLGIKLKWLQEIALNEYVKCERVVKAFIKVSAGVKHRNDFFRKKLSNKYIILAIFLAIIYRWKLLLYICLDFWWNSFTHMESIPVNKFGAAFEWQFWAHEICGIPQQTLKTWIIVIVQPPQKVTV